jgi:nucleoside-diphosphate-sugar epimerase
MTSYRRCVLVTGATGALGVPLIHRLVAAGYHVTALARRFPRPGLLPHSVKSVACDVRTDARVAAATGASAVVVHLAGTKRGRFGSAFRVNVEGTEAVLEAAKRAGAERVVMASTIQVYGRTEPGIIAHEATAPQPHTAYAISKLAAEEAAKAASSGGMAPPVVILRIAAAYPAAGGNLARLERAVRRRHAVVPWSDRVRTLVHVEDVAAAVLLAAVHPDAEGETFNVTDGHLRTVKEIVSVLFSAAGRPVPRWRWPWTGHHLAVDGRRIQTVLGFSPAFHLENAGSAAACLPPQ